MLKELFLSLADFFYPPRCANCGGMLEMSGSLCDGCRGGAFFVRSYLAQDIGIKDIDAVLVIAHYRGGLQEILHKVKFFHEKHLTAILLKEFEKVWSKSGKEELYNLLDHFSVRNEKISALTVPTDEERLKERGYDLPEMLFTGWAANEGYELFKGLKRVKKTKPQYGLTGIERKNNMTGVMEAITVPDSKVILIFDDILTTGATLAECARALREKSSVDKVIIGIALASDNYGHE